MTEVTIITTAGWIGIEAMENRTTFALEVDDDTWWTAVDGGGMRLDGSEGGLWSGAFVPPPPRPLFLDEAAAPDGLTTCDLCSWAWQGQGHKPFHHVDAATEAPRELSWVLTLIIVSIISAAVGAVIMITVLHCKSRMKKGANTDASGNNTTNIETDSPDKDPGLGTVRGNHYTHMACEALYAELERGSVESGPAYQNSGYADVDVPTSSAPSSAYYSDLSAPERAYEEVGLAAWPPPALPHPVRLQTATMPSDYV